ncbi:hypothetical protein [Methyloversatilis universalis]|uniref:hypothetical protein n=1 Tax=Methyloversatilis universalis TaxID=378211 RepID=UPI0012F76D95|nr:hypothetical protein [Methyloversatilis universalis]
MPDTYDLAHDLCFVIHDILAQLLKSGAEGGFFRTTIAFEDEADRISFEKTEDIFCWLEETQRLNDRTSILTTTVFPAVLSDALHCIYEALESSRKAKPNITYMLLRKPIQESLFLFETIIINPHDFAAKLATDPLKLRGEKAGGLDAHTRRIQRVLEQIGEEGRFNAEYIAQLRYNKSEEDGFDGICNLAMHLFTEHRAIRTAPLNINFIFSDWEEKCTQWAYLYSRLPYLLIYMHSVVEHLCERIAPTHPTYLNDMQRRIAALTLLWREQLEAAYVAEPIDKLITYHRDWLIQHCLKAGYSAPTESDLVKMAFTGAFPREQKIKMLLRNFRYKLRAALNRRSGRRSQQ